MNDLEIESDCGTKGSDKKKQQDSEMKSRRRLPTGRRKRFLGRRTFAITRSRREIAHSQTPDFATRVHCLVIRLFLDIPGRSNSAYYIESVGRCIRCKKFGNCPFGPLRPRQELRRPLRDSLCCYVLENTRLGLVDVLTL